MAIKYKSKIDLAILIPLALILLITEALMIVNDIWPSAIIIGVIILLIAYLYLNTYYTITKSGILKIKCGFLINKNINIMRIKKVIPTTDPNASPALSLERLRILYNENEDVLISPKKKKDFLTSLKRINPNIEIEP